MGLFLGVLPRYAIVRTTVPDGPVTHIGVGGQPGLELYGGVARGSTAVILDGQLGPRSAEGRPSVLNRGQLMVMRGIPLGGLVVSPTVGLQMRPLPSPNTNAAVPSFTSATAAGGLVGVRVGTEKLSATVRGHLLNGGQGAQAWVSYDLGLPFLPIIEVETLKVGDARYSFLVLEAEWSIAL